MSVQNDKRFEVYDELILKSFLTCKAIEIHGINEVDGVCEPVKKGDQYDFLSLYFRFIEGDVLVVGDFGKNCLETLSEAATQLSKTYNLPVYSFIKDLDFKVCSDALITPGLSFSSHIYAYWHHCDGEKWAFISNIEMGGIFIAEYQFSHIHVSDISDAITSSGLVVSASNCRHIAKELCDYILKLAKETYPKVSAHEHYYGEVLHE